MGIRKALFGSRVFGGYAVAALGVVALMLVGSGGIAVERPPTAATPQSPELLYARVGQFHVRQPLEAGVPAAVVLPCGDDQSGVVANRWRWSADADEITYAVNFVLSTDQPRQIGGREVMTVGWRDAVNRSDDSGKQAGVPGKLESAYWAKGNLLADQVIACRDLADGEVRYLSFPAVVTLADGSIVELVTEVSMTKDTSTMKTRYNWQAGPECPITPCLG